MASFFTHPVFPVALLISKARPFISKKLFILCVLLTLIPDADVIAFRFGIPYASQWGHRGFTHSIVFALLTGVICTFFARKLDSTKGIVFLTAFLSTLSHSVLDAMTNGGLGVAIFWPLNSERYFFPFHPVEVSPIGVKGFLSLRGLVVVFSEIIWIWTPCLILSFLVRTLQKRHR